ncbi:MAG: hypothetical protein ABI612_25050, partial [Betaproteobacteria bacterium]
SFTAKQWGFIEAQLEQLPDTPSARRLAFVCSLGFGTGLRLSELVNAKCMDFDRVELDSQSEGWVLNLVSRGFNSDPRRASENV